MPRRKRTNSRASSVVEKQFIFSKCAPKAVVNAFLANPTSGMIRGIIARTMGVRIPAETRTKRELDAFFIDALEDPNTPVNMPSKPYDRTCMNSHHWSNMRVPANQQMRQNPSIEITMPTMRRGTFNVETPPVSPTPPTAPRQGLQGIEVPRHVFHAEERVIDVPVNSLSVRRSDIYNTTVEGMVTVTVPSALRRYWVNIQDADLRRAVQTEQLRQYAQEKIATGTGVDLGRFDAVDSEYYNCTHTLRPNVGVLNLGSSSNSVQAMVNGIESHNRTIIERSEAGETDG